MNLSILGLPATLALGLALGACADARGGSSVASSAAPINQILAGTSWRLVEFQSMDDGQSSPKPANPDDYTVSFGFDGSVAFQFDCNLGRGNWTAAQSADGNSGSISFGPIASTMAICPEPTIGEKLARDVQHMAGYLIREGRLSISLKADGGIYVWEPISEGHG